VPADPFDFFAIPQHCIDEGGTAATTTAVEYLDS
jgi:hypothetical protein